MKQCVVILGMHHSGASVLSKLLSSQGYYFKDDEILDKNNNFKEVYENGKIYQLNQSILDDYEVIQDNYDFTFDKISKSDLDQYENKACKIIKEEFELVDRIFIKDPSMCFLFPLWEKVLKDLYFDIKILLVYRNPIEFSYLLKLKNKIVIQKGILIWSHYFFQAEKNSRDYDRMLVHYADDFHHIDELFIALSHFLDISLTDARMEDVHKLSFFKCKYDNVDFSHLLGELPLYLKKFISILGDKKRESSKEELDEIIDEFYVLQSLYFYKEKQQTIIINNINSKMLVLMDKLEIILEESKKYQCKIKKQKKQIILIKNNLSDKINLLSDREKKLSISYNIFEKISTDQKWKRRFVRATKGNNYFKLKYFLSSLEKKTTKILLKEKIKIIDSGFFSLLYYLVNNSDVWEKKIDPLTHYCLYGWKEGRNPSPDFNTKDYLSMYSDVSKLNVNPLLHYIEVGINEGRKPVKPILLIDKIKKTEKSTEKEKTPEKEVFFYQENNISEGIIDSFENGYVSGSFLSINSIPILRANNILIENIEREKGSLKFKAKILHPIVGKVEIELLSLDEKKIILLDKKLFTKNWFYIDKYADLEMAYAISNDKNSVAITVWEGGHNPIGRAKVLYDIIKTERPAVIFAYIFSDFSEDLWTPLRSSGINIVLIPYQERHSYYQYIQDRCIKFNTIWICKNRLHSFELAAMLSKPKTACILDIDDNEDVFVASKPSVFKSYGLYSKNKADYYLNKIAVRSVASLSLLNKYGGNLLRHARKEYIGKSKSKSKSKDNNTKRAVFIGTIRPHKNISELVDALSYFNSISKENIKLAIGGDFNPSSLKRTLKTQHTIILDNIFSDDLFEILFKYDVLITGFPNSDNQYEKINKYQITSKIGDGLAIGRPVLTPLSPSVVDLQNIPGLFVFTQENFNEKLREALEYKNKIYLPRQFSLDYSYEIFSKLESKAKIDSIASNIFMFEAFYNKNHIKIEKNKKNLVLIWKQHDAGVYGRRIDHIARYYKQRYPECHITIIEVMHQNELDNINESKINFDNSISTVNEVLYKKIYNFNLEGVNYRLITFNNTDGWNSFEEKMKNFTITEKIYPYNSVVIFFPLHDIFNKISSLFRNYKVIVDLVDNQIKWITSSEEKVLSLKQYYNVISIADEIVSNSRRNLNYFRKLGFLERKNTNVISNWYTLPKNFSFKRLIDENTINIIYSGNMNDRIDWGLLKDICKLVSKYNGYLHIIGSTIRKPNAMKDLLSCSACIYHGVIKETQLLQLLQYIDVAVIPHIEDSISKFMDPIKLKMYEKLGIITVTTNLPTLQKDNPLIIISESKDVFLGHLDAIITNCKTINYFHVKKNTDDRIGNKYISLINKLFFSSEKAK